MSKLKLAVAAVLTIILAVVIVQNTESVETRLLFATVTMPRAVLLFLCMALGFVIGLLTAYSVIQKKKPKAS